MSGGATVRSRNTTIITNPDMTFSLSCQTQPENIIRIDLAAAPGHPSLAAGNPRKVAEMQDLPTESAILFRLLQYLRLPFV